MIFSSQGINYCADDFVLALNQVASATKTMRNFKFDQIQTAPAMRYVITGTLSASKEDVAEYLKKYNCTGVNVY